jgi:hypothetical protein
MSATNVLFAAPTATDYLLLGEPGIVDSLLTVEGLYFAGEEVLNISNFYFISIIDKWILFRFKP